jgi:hypothetical protein
MNFFSATDKHENEMLLINIIDMKFRINKNFVNLINIFILYKLVITLLTISSALLEIFFPEFLYYILFFKFQFYSKGGQDDRFSAVEPNQLSAAFIKRLAEYLFVPGKILCGVGRCRLTTNDILYNGF